MAHVAALRDIPVREALSEPVAASGDTAATQMPIASTPASQSLVTAAPSPTVARRSAKMEPAVERVEIPVEVATSVTAAVSGDTVAHPPITAAPAASHPLEPALLPRAEGLQPLLQQRNLHPLASRRVQTTLVVAPMVIHAHLGCVGKS